MTNETKQGTTAAMVRAEAAGPIEPTNMGELNALARAAATSGFFGAKTQEQALVVLMAGRDLGLSYPQALRAFHVIEGKPSLSAEGMVGVCLARRDVCEFFRTVEASDATATVEAKRVGAPAVRRTTFTLEDARRAELLGRANWKKYPSRMLLARARAMLARDLFPDLLLGLYDPDELGAEPPQRVEMHATPAPAFPSEPEPDDAALIRLEMARVGREGTEAEAKTLMASIAKGSLSLSARASLREDAAAMLSQIRARAASQAPDELGDPTPSEPSKRSREPGEDDT